KTTAACVSIRCTCACRAASVRKANICSCMQLSAICDVTSRREHRGPEDPPRPQPCKRIIGIAQRKRRRLRPYPGLSGNFQKIQSVLTGKIGNRNELPFFPKETVWKARDIAHVDARANNLAAFAYRAQC